MVNGPLYVLLFFVLLSKTPIQVEQNIFKNLNTTLKL